VCHFEDAQVRMDWIWGTMKLGILHQKGVSPLDVSIARYRQDLDI